MSVEINGNNATAITTETLLEVKVASLAKTQTELEGQMALALIDSASIENATLPAVGNSGLNVNIKV